jgi:hypothetical protein
VSPVTEGLVASVLAAFRAAGSDGDRVQAVITADICPLPDSEVVQVNRLRVLRRGAGVLLDVGGFQFGATPEPDPEPAPEPLPVPNPEEAPPDDLEDFDE